MKEEGIILSDEHGVNPSIEVCMLCEKDMGIIMFGRLPNDEKAPMKVCMGHICDDCKKRLKEENKVVFIRCEDERVTGEYLEAPIENVNPDFIAKYPDTYIFHIEYTLFDLLCNV